MKRVGTGLLTLLLWIVCSTSTQARPITASVGTGPDTAFIMIEFDSQTQFFYEVAFTSGAIGSGDEVYSIDLLRLLAAELTDIHPWSTLELCAVGGHPLAHLCLCGRIELIT